MKRMLWILLLAPSLLAAERAPFSAPAVAPEFREVESTSLYLPMHDGTRIAVDLLLPKELPPQSRIPALFKIARFGRAPLDGSIAAEDRFWVAHGFARVLIDERGTGASFGTSGYGSAEVSDLREITDWVVKQPWSNGRVGAIGISVEGTASELLAATGHPAVRAVAPLFSDYNFYTDLIRPGGVYHEWLMKNFGGFVKEMDGGAAAKRVAPDMDGSLLRQAIADHRNNAGLYDSTKNAEFIDDPLPNTGTSLLGLSIPPLTEALKKSHVPMLIFVSWFDAGTVQGTLQRYRDFGNVQRIFIGAWSHGGGFDANPFKRGGSPSDPGPEQQLAEALAFFNHYLKDIRDDASAKRGIHYFTAGTNQWQQTNVWPPPGLSKIAYHLDGEGKLDDRTSAETIAVALKNTATGDQNRWRTQFGGHPVAYDGVMPQLQTLTSFTTTPLDKPLEITGQPALHIRLSCAGGDPSLFAYLTALDDQGKAVYLTEGQLRLSNRKGTFLRGDADPVPNGAPIDATISFLPTSVVVPVGWRLRLLLASGDTSSFTTSGPFAATIFSSSTIELPAITHANAESATAGAKLTAKQWHDDLGVFARELASRHANAFHHITRAQFDEEVAALDRQLDTLDSDAIYIGLDRIAASIGDAHTFVRFPADSARLQIVIAHFDGVYRVALIAPGLEQALGARIVNIEGTPIARVRELIESITPAEEPRVGESLIPQHMALGLVLHGLGIAPSRDLVHFTLADDAGHEFVVAVHAGPLDKLVSLVTNPPLFRQDPDKRFWFTWLPGPRAVYCNFRGYQDLETNAQALLEFVAEKHAEKLIIDLRQNGGGDYFEGLRHLVEPIRKLPEINRKGHLFVLIGVQTFSAAMANAAHFRQMTAATLVGRTIGESPNSYQEPRERTLPNSKLVFRYSTKLYEFNKDGENAIRPDHEVTTTWEEYKAGRDPVMDWVLGQ
jgi:uncharacterized protein